MCESSIRNTVKILHTELRIFSQPMFYELVTNLNGSVHCAAASGLIIDTGDDKNLSNDDRDCGEQCDGQCS